MYRKKRLFPTDLHHATSTLEYTVRETHPKTKNHHSQELTCTGLRLDGQI
jgi:hypothetical protein